jgi:hypothetical protein
LCFPRPARPLVAGQAEDRHIAACQTLIDSQKGSGEIVAAVKAAFAEKETLVHLEAQAKAVAERNKVAKDFEARLQTLVNRKSEEETKAYKALVDKIYVEVLQTVKTDAKFKAVRTGLLLCGCDALCASRCARVRALVVLVSCAGFLGGRW